MLYFAQVPYLPDFSFYTQDSSFSILFIFQLSTKQSATEITSCNILRESEDLWQETVCILLNTKTT